MLTMIEVKQIASQEQLNQMILKLQEVIRFGEVVTVSWKKTQFDIFYETFEENKNINNKQEYITLEKLVHATTKFIELHTKILLTLVKYNINETNYTIAIHHLKLLQELNLQYPDRHQYLEILKTLKNISSQIPSILDIRDVTKLLIHENLLSKDDLSEFYVALQLEPNSPVNIWFQEQVLNYEKHNISMAYNVFKYYSGLNDWRSAQVYYCLGLRIKNDKHYEMQYMIETFDQHYEQFLKNQKEIENLQQQLDSNKSSGSNNLVDQQQICKQLVSLKKNNNYPIIEIVQAQIQLSQLYKQENKTELAIQTIEEALHLIKLEKLINYNLKLIYQESLCYDQLGEYYKLENKLVESLQSFQDSLELKEESKEQNSKQLLFTKMQLAGMYSKLKNFDKSIEIFFQVLKTQQKFNCESHIIGSTQNNIASILLAQGSLQKALQFSELALQNLGKKYQENDEIMKKVKGLRDRIDSKLNSV